MFHARLADFRAAGCDRKAAYVESTAASQGSGGKTKLRSKEEETRQVWIHSQLSRIAPLTSRLMPVRLGPLHLVIPNSSIAS